jgi:copper chaperone NosL
VAEPPPGKVVGLIAFLILVLPLAGCRPGSTTGQGEIHWDRQTCEQCQMAISERRHAAQIRKLGERRTHSFDDLGCALFWLDEQGLLAGSEQGPEVWVKEATDSKWIDARTARFEAGFSTPMAYGFGVADQGMTLSEVQERVREKENGRRFGPLQNTDQHDHAKD